MPGLRRVAPELPVHDMGAALEYYTGQLGFDVAAVMPNRDYAIVERDDVALHLFSPDSGTQSAVSIHVFATGLDELFSELERRGALISQAIVRKPWGNREFRVADAAGNIIKFTEPVG
jgi:uncharacterized glyoxalase superfamily protein PhnB